jgi:predicted Zn-dependent peptidase
MAGMMELLTDMPTSEKGFENAKQGAIQQIQTTRITKDAILSSFHSNRRLGITDDYRKGVYETIQSLKLNDIVAFQKENIKNLKYTIVVLGKKEKLDMNVLSKYGNVQTLELNDIFGY